MISKELLDLLVCPETRQPVRAADAALLEGLNERIRAGEVSTIGGRKVDEPLDAGLVREDGRVLYPVVDDIPVMLAEEGIPLGGGPGGMPPEEGAGPEGAGPKGAGGG